jgi:hypothetical protein
VTVSTESTPLSTAGRAFCAAVSSASSEPLAATASRIDHWLLVEYRGPWTRDVLGGSLLSDALKTHLQEQLALLPRSRLLFVKQPERRPEPGRRVFFGTSQPGAERFFRLDVDHQEDLRGVDLVDALAGDGTPGAVLDHPLLVVCTHGKRDRCCAKNGRPLYDALRRETEPDRVWQSSHVGGDRFAGNVVVLPHGVYYGRVGPGDVAGLLAAQAAGRLALDHYRGRSAYSMPVQAAEQAVRESEGLDAIGALTLLETKRRAEDRWRVRFRVPRGSVHEVEVEAYLADDPVYLTCDSAEPRRARRHRATAQRVLPADAEQPK